MREMLVAQVRSSHRWVGLASGLAATSIWGGMYVVSKAVMDVLPPFMLIVLRLLLGIATLWGAMLIVGTASSLRRFTSRQTWMVLGVGLIGYGVSLGFQFVGTNLSTASNGALVTSATPAFVLVIAALLLREKITFRKVVALALSTLGVLSVIDPRMARLSPDVFLGNIYLVLAALTWALYSVLVRRVTRQLPVLPVTLVLLCGGLPIALPLGAWEWFNGEVGRITSGVIAGVLFLGIISTALAMYLWNRAFSELEAGVATLTFFAQPVVGAGLGAAFLGERLSAFYLVGGALIAAGLWLAAGEEG
jgi:drug/metabolite transporter (DMT)-like permease